MAAIQPSARTLFQHLEIVVDNASGYSNAFEGSFSVRNARAPVGLGQIHSGNFSALGELFRILGFEVTFSYSPPRDAP